MEGKEYDHDIVIDAGEVRKRNKEASKHFREEYGHTPLSLDEDLPWGGKQFIIGTGMFGRLPVMPAVAKEAQRRGIDLIAVPTAQACQLLHSLSPEDVHAVLHVTC